VVLHWDALKNHKEKGMKKKEVGIEISKIEKD